MPNRFTREDFILDENGDFPLEDNIQAGVYMPTPYGISDSQHLEDICINQKGWNKQFPTLGFGVSRYLNSENSLQDIFRELKQECKSDGYDIQTNAVSPNNINGGFVIDFRYCIPVY